MNIVNLSGHSIIMESAKSAFCKEMKTSYVFVNYLITKVAG